MVYNTGMDAGTIGKKGEGYACDFLARKGYEIIDRNVRFPAGELDIVARAGDGTLVFVEVKTAGSFSNDGFRPEDHMTAAKVKKFRRVASLYANAKPRMVDNSKGFRLDLIALAKVGNDFVVNHYENVA